jgi:hypothetical protein
MTTRLFRALTVTALASALSLVADPRLLASSNANGDLSARYIGQVQRKCCRPGRRWGCDPANFNQSGCVHINQIPFNCHSRPMATMVCSGASCESAGVEDVCDLRLRSVGLNRCLPLGTRTTVGCPPDHWQCHIQLFRYTLPDAPRRDVMVCELSTSTICGSTTYSACD